MSTDVVAPYTVEDYLRDKVRFEVPKYTIKPILFDRGIEEGVAVTDCNKDTLRLCYADLLKWIILGASKVNNTSDSDNGWTHTGGGFEISSEDRKLIIKEANAIYSELEPSSSIKSESKFKMMSFGVQQAYTDTAGNSLPHIIQ
jgi:hypothetical protein